MPAIVRLKNGSELSVTGGVWTAADPANVGLAELLNVSDLRYLTDNTLEYEPDTDAALAVYAAELLGDGAVPVPGEAPETAPPDAVQ